MSAQRSFPLGYSDITWAGATHDLDRVFGIIAGAGWEGVEIHNAPLDWLGTPRHLRSLLGKHGLELACLYGTGGEGSAQQVLERQKRRIEYGAEVGCAVYCFGGNRRVSRRLPTDDEFKRLAEKAEALIDHATPLAITVAYHAHPGATVESEEDHDRLLAFTERLQVCIDVSVAALMQEDPVAQLHKYSHRLGYVHMKDLKRDTFCAMGQGTVGLDFGAIREALNDIGYTGWVVGELSGYWADMGDAESCYANREYLRSVGY